MKNLFLSFLFIFIWLFSFAQQGNEASSQNQNTDQKIKELNNVKKAVVDSLSDGIDTADYFIDNNYRKPDSLLNKLSANPISDSLNAALSAMSDSVAKINSAADKVRSKIPGTEIPDTSLPAIDKTGLKTDIPGIDLPNAQSVLGKYGDNLKKLNVSDIKSNIPETPDIKDISSNPDRFIENKTSQVDAVREFKDQSGMAEEQAMDVINKKQDIEKYGNVDQYKLMAKQKAIEQMNKAYTPYNDKLKIVQSEMSKLKEKYSSVPNSADLNTAVKANSLKEEPLKNRLIVGANFKLDKGNPLTLDFAPMVMYKFNKVFHAGLSGSYRASINYDDRNYSTNPQDVFGVSALTRHFLLKNFFAYSEFEYKSSTFSYDGRNWNSLSKREWEPALLAGIGKELSVMKNLKATIILTYDFLHSERSFTNSPWGFKFGFHLDDLKLKKGKKMLTVLQKSDN